MLMLKLLGKLFIELPIWYWANVIFDWHGLIPMC